MLNFNKTKKLFPMMKNVLSGYFLLIALALFSIPQYLNAQVLEVKYPVKFDVSADTLPGTSGSGTTSHGFGEHASATGNKPYFEF